MLRRAALALAFCVGCSSISTVRVQPESVYVGPHLRPIAMVHAQVTSAYILFIAIPGHVALDQVVNRMLLAPPRGSARTRWSTSRSISPPTTASGRCGSCSAGVPPRPAGRRRGRGRRPKPAGSTSVTDVLVLVLGKGGVGRSTIAAALAGNHAARARRRCCSRPTRTIASVSYFDKPPVGTTVTSSRRTCRR